MALQPEKPAEQLPGWRVAVFTLLPPATALLLTTILLLRANLEFGDFTQPETLNSLGFVALFILAGLATGYAMRSLIKPPEPTRARHPDEDPAGPYRDRLARYVVVAGTIGIFVTAAVLIIAIASARTGDWQTTILSIFTSVLPVFATWVGTVLAFYFTNESFRQAAQSTQGLLQNDADQPITRPGTMIPYDRVVRLELTSTQLQAAGGDRKRAAEDLPLDEVKKLFNPPGIIRIIIFDDKKIPAYVIHYDKSLETPAQPGAAPKLKDHLDQAAHRTTANNFTWISSTATIADARRLLELRRSTDLFVTQSGRNDEATIGWVPDDNLKKS